VKTPKKIQLFTIILTGLSGSGKTVALNAFEDSGFFCVDNLPTTLIKKFINICNKTSTITKAAIGVDIRERKLSTHFSDTISALRKKYDVQIIFLTSSEEALIRRFKETRRPHPLGYRDLKKALHREAKLLLPIRHEADKIIDTSTLSPHQLRKLILKSYFRERPKEMKINLISFGYKYGVPVEADLLFDVRFLPNPHFIEELKPFPGTSAKVKKFVLSQNDTKDFFDKLYPLLNFTIPLYRQEGRSYLTIGIGCTGGRHRSPAITEEIKKTLIKQKLSVSVTHRDMQTATSLKSLL
jgi:UPF0042 nucleotide-binding protein